MNESCKECMNGAPYDYCCKIECGEHEFCKNCEYIPRHKCYHEVSSPITDNDDKLLNVLEPVVNWSKARPLPPVTDKTDEKDLIPIEKVLECMYSDTSGVSLAARDYYRINYATEEEKIEMYREDRISNGFTAIVLIIPVVTIITIIIYHLFLN